jgi:hypothetical protein
MMFSRLMIFVFIAIFGLIYFQTSTDEVKRDSAADLPEVIRVPGGLLEVATLTRTETFELERPTKIVIWKTDLCGENAKVELRSYTTYRIKLAAPWEGRVRNGTLYVETPPLEPSLPVAYDTRTFRKEISKCWLVPNRGTMADLEKDVSKRLEVRAQSAAYKKFAEDNGAIDTIEEFVEKWLTTQSEYESLPDDIPVHVTIAG